MARFKIDADEIQRGLACASIIALSVIFVYNTLSFSVNTLKAGIVNTWNVLGVRAQRTMETLVKPLEDLIINADDQGAASLFDRYPWPSRVMIARKSAGVGSYKVTRFGIECANLDVLRDVEVNLDGMSLTEEVHVESPISRDLERWDWPARSILEMKTGPLKAVVTVVAHGGARWKHLCPVKYEDEYDDSQVASRGRKSPSPGTPGGGTPTTPASAVATAAPTAEPDKDDGQGELAAIIGGMSMLPASRRANYVKAIKDDAFEEVQLMGLLGELHRSRGNGKDIDAQFLKLLSARYMQGRKVRGQQQPLLTASPSEVRQALEFSGRGKLVNEIDVAGSVSDGVRSILGKVYTASLVPATTSSASPGAANPNGSGGSGGNQPEQTEGKLEEAVFSKIWDQEQKYKDCMAIVDLLQKAYDVDNQDSVTPGSFDMDRLHTKGHIEFVPSCPDPGAGGVYQMDATHKVRCTTHGNRALPWSERRQYERHFNEFERARILVRKQNRVREAIGTLKAYLSRDHAREEGNLTAQAYLGRLYFDDGNHEAAVEILKKLSDRFPKSVRLAYQTSLSFYVRGNEQLALEYAQQALKPAPSDFDRTFDEESTPYELYLLRDECEWMRQNLAPEKIMADGSKRQLPPMRYADFAIKSRPTAHSKTCYENLAKLREMIARLVHGVRAAKDFKSRYANQETQKDILSKIPDYEKTPRLKGAIALSFARRTLTDMAVTILKDTRVLEGTTLTACPDRGIFHLSILRHLAVDCTAHPGILPAERIEISPAVTEKKEVLMTDLVMQHALLTLAQPLSACVERQRRILEACVNDVGDVAITADTRLDDLEKDGRIPKGTLHPSAEETYSLVDDGDHRVLECSMHYSLQRLAALQDCMNLTEDAKSSGGE